MSWLDDFDSRLSEVLAKYNPNQARDYHGRFSGDGVSSDMASGWTKMQPTAEDRQVYWDKLRSKMEARGDSPEFIASVSSKYLSDTDNSYNHYFRDYSTYQNSNGVRMIVENDLPNAKELTAQVSEYVNELQSAYPLSTGTDYQPTIVLSRDSILSDGTDPLTSNGAFGIAIPNYEGTFIMLNNDLIDKTFSTQDKDLFMMASQEPEVKPVEYVMAHEWGHAWNLDQNRQPEKEVYAKLASIGATYDNELGRYAKQLGKANETYAELFAQNYLETKYPEITKSYIVPEVREEIRGVK